MSKPVKLPEIRKEAFTKAREALGLTPKDVSGMSCFSVRQIEQIENGETSSFYGEQNKVTAAKRVAELLKLNPEEAFDFGGTQIAPKNSPENSSSESTDAAPLSDSAKSTEAEKLESQKELFAEKKVNQPARVTPTKSFESLGTIGTSKVNKQKDPKKRLLIFLGIAAALIFSVMNLRPLFFPEPPKEEVVVVEEVVQAPEPEAKPEAAPVAAIATAAECPAADAPVISYKADAPKKPGDMVYAQSKIAQTICVVDATGKTQVKALEPGVGVSIYGKPPLKVLTGGLNQVDLFYQGDKVRLKNASGKTILLEPAEIIQPIAPAAPTVPDSQR
jgi:cytoskeleton protein RodZ